MCKLAPLEPKKKSKDWEIKIMKWDLWCCQVMGETPPSEINRKFPKCQPSLYFRTFQLATTACEKEVACPPKKKQLPSVVFDQFEPSDVLGGFEVDPRGAKSCRGFLGCFLSSVCASEKVRHYAKRPKNIYIFMISRIMNLQFQIKNFIRATQSHQINEKCSKLPVLIFHYLSTVIFC